MDCCGRQGTTATVAVWACHFSRGTRPKRGATTAMAVVAAVNFLPWFQGSHSNVSHIHTFVSMSYTTYHKMGTIENVRLKIYVLTPYYSLM